MQIDDIHAIVPVCGLRSAILRLAWVHATLQVQHGLVLIEGEDLLLPNTAQHVL